MSRFTRAILDFSLRMGPAPFLKLQGFKKRRFTFARLGQESTLIINFQNSVYSLGKSGGFTINLAVHFPDVERILGTPTNTSGTIGERIGHLMPARGDHWWKVTGHSSPRKLGMDLLEVIRTVALPWLTRKGRMENAKRYCIRRGLDWLASAFCLALGQKSEAQHWFEVYVLKQSWSEAARSYLNCLRKAGLAITSKMSRHLRNLPTYDQLNKLRPQHDLVYRKRRKPLPPCMLPYCRTAGHWLSIGGPR